MAATAIIIAGGKSTRMNANKALLKINNKTMLQIIIDNLKLYFSNFIIVTNEPELYEQFDIIKVSDILIGHGPLSGIHAGLSFSKTDKNFILACDMPYVKGDLASYIYNYEGDWEVATPKLGKFYQPLFAAYKKSCIPKIEESVLNNERKITSFYPKVKVRYIIEEEILNFGDPDEIFSNINTPEEFEKLLKKGR